MIDEFEVCFRSFSLVVSGSVVCDTGNSDRSPPIEVYGSFRLQNRNELIRNLGLDVGASDDQLIEMGWRRWKTGLADRLRGAFALVIFDRSEGTLYAARDVFGLEPLFLGCDNGRWVFADAPGAVRSALGTRPAIDNLSVADFLSGHIVERDRTFFVGIERLPAAHWTQVVSGKRITQRYWSVSDAPRHCDVDDQPRRFRELFDRAVSFNVQDQRNVCVFVSGGMDSSSVLASLLSSSACDRRVLGVTRTYRNLPEWSDERYIDLLKQSLKFDQFEMPGDLINPLEDIEVVILANDGPVNAYGLASAIPLYRHARDNECRVILDGHGGDEIVSLGMGLLNELAQRRDWVRLWSATRAAAKMYGGSRLRWFNVYLKHIKTLRALSDMVGRFSQPVAANREASILCPDLEEAIGTERYTLRSPHSSARHTERDLHEFVLGSPIQQYAQELLVLVSRTFGVESRMPFLDRDLAEFSLSLPAEAKLRNGLTRAILRDAMADSLPQELLERPDKFDFSDAFKMGLLQNPTRLLELTDPVENDLGPFVNELRLEELRTKIIMCPEAIDIYEARTLFRVAQLAIWLRSLK